MTDTTSKVVYLDEPASSRRKRVLEGLFQEHETALRHFLRVRLGPTGPIDDLVQDVYLRLANIDDLIDKVNAKSGSTRSYLFSVANNLVIDRARRRKRRRELGHTHLDDVPDPEDRRTPEHIVDQRDELARIRECIRGMQPKWRRALLLHRFSHMNYRQVAEVMGVAPKRVEKYISAALRVLREDRERHETGNE